MNKEDHKKLFKYKKKFRASDFYLWIIQGALIFAMLVLITEKVLKYKYGIITDLYSIEFGFSIVAIQLLALLGMNITWKKERKARYREWLNHYKTNFPEEYRLYCKCKAAEKLYNCSNPAEGSLADIVSSNIAAAYFTGPENIQKDFEKYLENISEEEKAELEKINWAEYTYNPNWSNANDSREQQSNSEKN